MRSSAPFLYSKFTSYEVPKDVSCVRTDTSVKQIERAAFFRRRKLLQVDFSEGLEVVGFDSFSNCRLLKNIVLPFTIVDLKDDAFAHGRNLTKVSLPKGLRWIGQRSFADCTALKTIQIPCTVQELQFRTFVNCRNLTSVELSDGLKVISEKAFEHCTSLRNLVIPSTVEVVEENAFAHCMKLQQRFPYTEDLMNGLRQRFDGFPIHRLCYLHAFQECNEEEQDYNSVLQEQRESIRKNADSFGMTPVHILALSTKPDLGFFLALLREYESSNVLVTMKDRWGSTPFDYLCLNNTWFESNGLMESLTDVTILSRAKALGLSTWKQDIAARVDCFLRRGQELSEQASGIFSALAKYERMEVTSLLELALRKTALQESEQTSSSELGNIPGEAVLIVRKRCRVGCGIEIVLSNVMPFLSKQHFA
eukprot:scaffold9780_cov117-Cylindrotheca_fusiformis.AAC.2